MSDDSTLEHADGGRRSTEPEPWWAQARNVVWSLGPVTVAFLGLLAVVLGWLPSPMLSGIEAGTTTGLSAGTIYRVRIKHSDIAGNVSANYSDRVTFTTATTGVILPCQPVAYSQPRAPRVP